MTIKIPDRTERSSPRMYNAGIVKIAPATITPELAPID